MTLDQLISRLQELRSSHPGDTEVRIWNDDVGYDECIHSAVIQKSVTEYQYILLSVYDEKGNSV